MSNTLGINGCARCPARWGGYNTSHCGACHETFSTVGNFEKHRVRGQCVDPSSVGLVKTKYWATPNDGSFTFG